MMQPVFFTTPAELRDWLAAHHAAASERWIGFYKKASRQPGITYAEALDEALCFGWIDGLRKSLGAESFTIRFSPRRPGSIWSNVNIQRMEALIALGRVEPAGLAAFHARDPAKSAQYSYEARSRPLDAAYQAVLEANSAAWEFFRTQAPSYQRAANWWIMSARQEATRQRRLATLIALSAGGQRLPQLVSPARRSPLRP